jgi:hypothetical protein
VAFDIDKAGRQLAYEGRWFLGLARRLITMSDTITKSAAKIEDQAAEIAQLKEALRELQVGEKLAIARMEAAVTRAAAEATGELSRRLGFLEGRASRDP